MNNKIVISKKGYDAEYEDNPDNIVFSSDYNTLKYHISGNSSINIVGDGTLKTTTNTIAHNLGYAPFFIVYVNDFTAAFNTGNYAIVPYSSSVLTIIRLAEAWVDSTNLYVKLTNKSSSTYTANFYYKIFSNNLGL